MPVSFYTLKVEEEDLRFFIFTLNLSKFLFFFFCLKNSFLPRVIYYIIQGKIGFIYIALTQNHQSIPSLLSFLNRGTHALSSIKMIYGDLLMYVNFIRNCNIGFEKLRQLFFCLIPVKQLQASAYKYLLWDISEIEDVLFAGNTYCFP